MSTTNTIKITAQSGFHGNISQSFRLPAKEGIYYRYCPNPCDYKMGKNGIAIHCGCGWPVARTNWDAPEGWEAYAEWTDGFTPCGKNNIVIHLLRTREA